MEVRVFVTGAVQTRKPETPKIVVGRIERVLPGKDQRRSHSPRRQGPGNRCEFDGFGAGADNQPDVCGMQASP